MAASGRRLRGRGAQHGLCALTEPLCGLPGRPEPAVRLRITSWFDLSRLLLLTRFAQCCTQTLDAGLALFHIEFNDTAHFGVILFNALFIFGAQRTTDIFAFTVKDADLVTQRFYKELQAAQRAGFAGVFNDQRQDLNAVRAFQEQTVNVFALRFQAGRAARVNKIILF